MLPIDFESSTTTYTFSDFEGGVATVIANPDASGINTSAMVGSMVKNAGQNFGGSTLALSGPIDFGTSNAFTMKVWSNAVGQRVLFKLEGTSPAEIFAETTVANQWETLTFSAAGLTDQSFTGITLIYRLGEVGDGSADFTMYFDDIELATMMPMGVSIPVDFESTSLTYTFADFAGGVGSVVTNPVATGINTSANVAQVVKFAGDVFGGTTLALGVPVDFGMNNAIKMKVFSNRVGAPVLFKLEGQTPAEVSMMTTVANEWEELEFNFTGFTDAAYTGITIIYDLGVVGDGSADFTLLLDDIDYTTISGPAVSIPVDFESTDLTYSFSDFAGGVASVVTNPIATGINTSANVGQMIKFAGDVFGGSTLALGVPVDFGTNNAIKMKVFSNRVGAPVLFKLEGPAPAEVSMMTTVANEWEELEFNFTGLTSATYTGITIIYDLGVVGDGSADFTLLFDDIDYTTATGPVVGMPVDFESTDLTYSFSDFAGGVGSVIDNPNATGINTSNKVGSMVKFSGDVFGGSTLAIGEGIDFGTATAITMKTHANRVGAPVLLKLENGSSPIEISANTTVANEWETLTFDFTGLVNGSYNAATIIYDLGTVGDGSADFTLYFDDIQFQGAVNTQDLNDLGVSFFPNPATTQLTIQSSSDLRAVEVYNVNGQRILANEAVSNNTISTAGLAKGVYVLRVTTSEGVGTSTFVKQ